MPRGEGFITVGVFENFGVAKLEAKSLIDSFQPTNIGSNQLAIESCWEQKINFYVT